MNLDPSAIAGVLGPKRRLTAATILVAVGVLVAILYIEYRLIIFSLIFATVAFVAFLDLRMTSRFVFRHAGTVTWRTDALEVVGGGERISVPYSEIRTVYVGPSFFRVGWMPSTGGRSIVIAAPETSLAKTYFDEAQIETRYEPHVLTLLGMLSGVVVFLGLGVVAAGLVAGAIGNFFGAGGSPLQGTLMIGGAVAALGVSAAIKMWIGVTGAKHSE